MRYREDSCGRKRKNQRKIDEIDGAQYNNEVRQLVFRSSKPYMATPEGRDRETLSRVIKDRNWRPLVKMLSAVVVFVVSYMLILPALTLDEDKAREQGGVDLPSSTLEYEADGIRAEAVIKDTAPLPEDAHLVVTPLDPQEEAFSAYKEALQRDSGDDTCIGSVLMYDVSVITGEGEYEPADGSVEVSLTFSNHQITEVLGVTEESEVSIFHLPVQGKSR